MRIRFLIGASVALLVLVTIGVFAVRGRSLPLGVHTLHADDKELQQVTGLGGSYVVQVFAWNEIEPTRGEFHWEYTDWLMRAAAFYHLAVVARLDKTPAWAASRPSAVDAPPDRLDDYAAFAARVADRYRGHVAAYIIWNEPNLSREWGDGPPDPAAYAAMLKSAAAALRSADPGARIVSAGLAPTNDNDKTAMDDRAYLRAVYAAGARDSFDILGAHPYGFANPPDDPRGAHGGLNFLRVLDLRDIMTANGDVDKPVWITEFGYATTDPASSSAPAAHSSAGEGAPPPPLGQNVSEDEQARWLPQAYEIACEQMPFVQLFTVWNLASGLPGTDSQAGYSLVHADGSPKPAFATLGDAQKQALAASAAASAESFFARPAARNSFPVLARDSVVHLGDSEYPSPWVPLYLTRNPSTAWSDQLYLMAQDLRSAGAGPWQLTMELMQVNDFDSRVLVNGNPVEPPYLPSEDFTSVWVSAQFRVPAESLHVGRNDISLLDGKAFPAFQQLGYTWDDFQVRNVVLRAPK